MTIREFMKRACAIVTAVAFVGYFSVGDVQVKAYSDDLEGTVLGITEDDESVGNDNSNASIEQETEGKKKKNYIVKLNTKKALKSVKSKYSESEEINGNTEERLEDNKMVPLELSGKQAESLESSGNVKYIEEDHMVTASTKGKKKGLWYKKDKQKHTKRENRHKTNNSSIEWNVKMIKADKSMDRNMEDSTGRVKVAILDSGVDWGNDINLVYQTSLVPGEEEMTQVFMDGTGHGSSVASLIAAEDDGDGITGINRNVDIYSYRVLDDENKAPVSRVVEAVYMAIKQKVNIINMSFGLNEYSEALKEAVHDAKEAGILVIAAAGNTGDGGVQYPASYEDVMAVGAVDQYGTVEDYSARGKEVEIVAPGELIRTTGFIGSEEVVSGTSLAAPQVTAVASLIWQKDLEMPAEFVRGLLNESANLYGETDKYGNGLVDADYALTHYEEYKQKYMEREIERGTSEEREQLIAENKMKVNTFSDTGCIEGCWSRDNHERLVDGTYFCVRIGARLPDLKGRKTVSHNGETREFDFGLDNNRIFGGMTVNPWWHGYFKTNYIKAAIYATRMADAIGTYGDHDRADDLIGNGRYDKAGEMRNSINKLKDHGQNGWKYVLLDMQQRNAGVPKAQNQGNTNGFKRAVVWGMAIHTATDTYAHSAIHRGTIITHTGLSADADNIDYIRRRYDDASDVANQMMNCYLNKRGLTARDLVMPGNYTLGYELKDYTSNIQAVDSSITYTYLYSPK